VPTANFSPVSGKYVGFQLLDAASIQAVSGVALTPELGHYTGSGTIPVGFENGTWHINWTIVTLTDNVVFASEPFSVQDVNVQVGFVPSTDTTGSIYEAVRIDIGDPEGKIFNDEFLKHVLVKAARRVNHRLGLSAKSRPLGIPGGFGGPRIKVAHLDVNVETGFVSPANDELEDILILMCEYIVVTGETSALKRLGATYASGPYAIALGSVGNEGISVRNADGVDINISAGRLQARTAMQRLDVETREKELEAAIRAFLSRMTGNFGKMVY
jgi:hypothetical protein